MKTFKEIIKERKESPAIGLPQKPIDIGNGETYTPGPNQAIRNSAKAYMKSKGMKYSPPKDYKPVNPERGKKIADEYAKMKHDPNHPDVKASYQALAKETMDQFHHMTKNDGIKISWMPQGHDPYAKTPHLGAKDVRENKHLFVYPTDHGFGSSDHDSSDHPMLQKTGVHVGGREMVINDAFRAVHDYYGHFKEGHGFGPSGEDNAWRHHRAMYSEKARPAMTTETRGQNSFVNFGPHAAHNKKATAANTIYADQKAGIMHKFTEEDN